MVNHLAAACTPAEPAPPLKLRVRCCVNGENAIESANVCVTLTRLCPVMACAPKPIRSQRAGAQPAPRRTSAIAPSISNLVVIPTLSTAVRCWTVVNDVVDVRSSNVDAERLATQPRPIGIAPKTTGQRAVVVCSVPAEHVALRESGA